jgi:type VI secretion system protein ImpG
MEATSASVGVRSAADAAADADAAAGGSPAGVSLAAVDRQAARANRLRIEGIREVRTRPVERLVKGVPVRGVGTTLELDEGSFSGDGDLYLFASVIDEVLAAHAGINTFSELSVKTHPSQAEYSWKAKSGQQPIL